MRSLIILIISIVLLLGYVEWHMQGSHRSKHNQTTNTINTAKIIRATTTITKPSQAITKKSVATSKKRAKRTPLNLTIPSIGNTLKTAFPEQQRTLDWSKITNSKEDILYEAELVFDEKEGSSIKGGKVNIRIPFG